MPDVCRVEVVGFWCRVVWHARSWGPPPIIMCPCTPFFVLWGHLHYLLGTFWVIFKRKPANNPEKPRISPLQLSLL